jgi:hypothetical protein
VVGCMHHFFLSTFSLLFALPDCCRFRTSCPLVSTCAILSRAYAGAQAACSHGLRRAR